MRKREDEENPRRHVEMPARRRQPPELMFVANPTYDMLLSLHLVFNANVFTESELDQEWISRARAACPPDLSQTLMLYFSEEESHGWCSTHLYGLLYRAPAGIDIPSTLDWLASQPLAEVLIPLLDRSGLGDDWREVASSIIQTQMEHIAPASELRGRIQAFTKRFPAPERPAVQRLLTRPEEERQTLLDALRTWYQLVFAAEVPHIQEALSREVALQRTRQATTNPADLFTSVIQGIAFEAPANIERIVLVPCVTIMPIIFSYTVDETLTYCYPIAQTARTAAEQETMTRREMVRLFEALGDDTRLRILHHLAHRQMYLTEISEQIKLTKATTRHHMVRLRAAGLVTLHMRDNLSYYSLRREALEEPTRSLLRYLGPKQENG